MEKGGRTRIGRAITASSCYSIVNLWTVENFMAGNILATYHFTCSSWYFRYSSKLFYNLLKTEKT